ncbi:MAG TPA: M23 family metallopeptidase [Terriglobia bacterium]|nr:M23 family metallopeptidase [Terriglobia bacterium]
MPQASRSNERGIGKASLVTLVVILLIIIGVSFKLFSNPAPTIKPAKNLRGIGLSRAIEFTVHDPSYRITAVRVELQQNGQTFRVPATVREIAGGPKNSGHTVEVSAQVGRREIPQLRAGRATLILTALNNSWGRLFRGGKAVLALNLPVRFMPPQVEVLTTQHYINLGGCGMVVFNTSPGTVRSGVEVGKYYFPSWPVSESDTQRRLCVFAFPYNVDPNTPARIVAEDDAGNQTLANFDYKVFPKKFHSSTLEITDSFMQRVVPPILSQTSDIQDQGSLLKNYVEINRNLRLVDKQRLIQFSKQTNPKFLWRQPFIQLRNSKVESSFADFRTYTYNGQVIDHEVHLGFDLAVVAHTPVVAANDGQVIFAGWFDIFGNAVLIDHGCGLQSLYGHLASSIVKPGELVKRGQLIGYSDSTGLAGGDHLHFAILLDGVPVNPEEWWDPHWIHDRITAKLQEYQK